MTPHQILERAIADHADQGHRPPCSVDPERWMGDDPSTYPLAQAICLMCPLITPCRAAGVLEDHGVWGGRIRTKTRPRKPSDAPTLFDLQEIPA